MNWLAAGIVLLIPTYLVRFTVFGIPTNFFEVVVMLGLLILLSTAAGRQQLRQAARRVPPWMYWWAGGLLIAAIVSVLVSDVPQVSWGILKGWFTVPMLAAVLVFTALGGKAGIQNARLTVDALVVSGVGTALLSLLSYAPGKRLAGIYDVPNSLALWLAPLTVLAVSQGLSEKLETRNQKLGTLYVGAALTMFGVLLLTQSVAGIVVTLIMLAVVLFRCIDTSPPSRQAGKQVRYALYLVGLGIAVTLFLWGAGRIQYFLQPNSSLAVRQQLWSISLDLIREQPLLGIGLGQFEPRYQEKLHERFTTFENPSVSPEGSTTLPFVRGGKPLREFVFRDPHNWILSFWLNAGLLGLISFSMLNVLALFPSLRRRGARRAGWFLKPATAALLTLLLFGLVDTIYWKNDLATLQWVLLALAYIPNKSGVKSSSPDSPAAPLMSNSGPAAP